ncbi:MAG: zinc ribbon domain-containing protein [Pyrinomonadaceae bacterium]
MPIYEYQCSECGSRVEKLQKVSDEPLKVCENCGGRLEKQWSLSGFQFKGEGWYVTDYAGKKGDKVAEKSEKTGKSESTEKGETASKKANDNSSTSKKDTVSKKD